MTDISPHRHCPNCDVRWRSTDPCWICGQDGTPVAAWVVPGSYQHQHTGQEEAIA